MKRCPHCKQFELTPNEARLMEMVKTHPGIEAAHIAKLWKKTVGNISNQLKKLSDLGFVWRDRIPDPTGGYFFKYYRKAPFKD